MKELPAGIQLVQSKYNQLKQKESKPLKKKELLNQVADQPKRLLSLPMGSSLEVLRQRTNEGLRRMESQGARINQLSVELEAALLELKAIALSTSSQQKQ